VICIVLQTDVAGPMKEARERKCEEHLIKFGFTSVVVKGDERSQCLEYAVKCWQITELRSWVGNCGKTEKWRSLFVRRHF